MLEQRRKASTESGVAGTKATELELNDLDEFLQERNLDRLQLVRSHHYRTLWTYAVNCILAILLMSSTPLYAQENSALALNDTVCSIAIILFECLAFVPRLSFMRFGTMLLASWLFFAPLVFWTNSAASYLLDTLVASLLFTFSLLIPGFPGQAGLELPGADMPPGWSYNPSSWIRRWLGIALALFGFIISRYLAAQQLGLSNEAWDPFFDGGTDRVLHSSVSHMFPISDAGLGAVAYLLEVLSGFMGGRARWRTAPWIAILFALLVIPLGITSVVLVISQPMIVGSWCGLCLIAASALLTSVPLAVHEAIAVGQFMLLAHSKKKSMWKILWNGGTIIGAGKADPNRRSFTLAQRWVASVQGVTVPLALFLQIAIGIWLMARPDIIPGPAGAASADHLLGALIVTVAAVATAEVTRIVRLANVMFGFTLILAASIFSRGEPFILLSEFIPAIGVILLAFPRGTIAENYGGWNKFVR